jgi:hypothetical protein
VKLFGRAEETAQRIVDAFKTPEALPKALAPIFIHRNDENVPCRRWSWYNQMLTVLSGTSDARGIHQWNTVGRKLKKGSKAIWILGPCLKTIREKDDNGEEVKRNVLYGFKGIPVFAVEDTEGKPLPGNEKYDEWMQNLPLLEVAQSWGIHVGTYSGEDKNALGYFQFGTDKKAIMVGVENLSTWAHELVHAADHHLTKLTDDRNMLEIVAELGGAILLECLGRSHDADLGGAFQYINRYAEATGKPPVKACMDVLDRTCKCVSLILDTAEQIQKEESENDNQGDLQAARTGMVAEIHS